MLNDRKGQEDSLAVGVASEKIHNYCPEPLEEVTDDTLGSLPRRWSIAGENSHSRGLERGIGSQRFGCRWAHMVISKVHVVLRLLSRCLGSIRSGLLLCGAIPTACTVLPWAVRTSRYGEWAAAEDGYEIATLWTGKVRAVMLNFGVGERAVRRGQIRVGARVEGMAKLPALGALGELAGREDFFNFRVAGEEVDRGEEVVSIR